MQSHVIPPARWLWEHRYPIALISALISVFALLALVTPWLLAIACVERGYSRDRRRKQRSFGVQAIVVLAGTARWIWRELHGIPHRPWHPCAQCGRPIEEPSRAAYCSHPCRIFARLERDALDHDPRIAAPAERRLRNLRLLELADTNPDLVEVPF
jgi:hypothetical protein